jgi:small-conductance mechanosensitive channel
MDISQWLDLPVYGGTPRDWLIALGLSVALALAVYLLKPVLLRRLGAVAQHSQTRVDDALLEALKATRLWIVAIFAASIGSRYLDLPDPHGKALAAVTALAFFLQAGLWASALFKFWLSHSQERAMRANPGTATSIAAVGFIGQLLLWSLVVLLALDNIGVNVTAMVAGLGVGGVAVALAVQNILGDLFASLSIVVDKPFVIGDFIIVDDYMGSVEYVGLKTTRIRSLDGEQIVFSNSDLLKSRVRNYKRMFERRVVFTFNLVYETDADQVELVPQLVREAIEAQDKIRFDRSHFAKFGEQSLAFETVYWVLDPDFNLYMDIHQRIMLRLMREFDRRGICFAIPRQMTRFEQPIRVQVETLPGDPPRGNGRTQTTTEHQEAH